MPKYIDPLWSQLEWDQYAGGKCVMVSISPHKLDVGMGGWESEYGVLKQCANILHLFSSMLVACPIHKIWSWYSEQIWLYEPSKTDLYEIWGHTKSSPESNIRSRLNVSNMVCYKARACFVQMYLYKLIQWTIGYKNMLQLKVVSHLANHVLLNNFEKPNQVESPETRSSCSRSQVWCQTVVLQWINHSQ